MTSSSIINSKKSLDNNKQSTVNNLKASVTDNSGCSSKAKQMNKYIKQTNVSQGSFTSLARASCVSQEKDSCDN